MEVMNKDKDIIVLDDDDDDVITSTADIALANKTKHKTISNLDLLTEAIGEANYNMIIDALCTVSNIETKAKALSALLSINKQVQNREVQTEPVQHSEEDCDGALTVLDDVSINGMIVVDEQIIPHSPDVNGFLQDDYCANEVIIDSQKDADSIITGEGELKLNHYSGSRNIRFVLKGDGKRKSRDEE